MAYPASNDESAQTVPPKTTQRPRRLVSRITIVVRRLHLYAGLFLLPWVFMYGVTGAMFNHQWLLPEVAMRAVETEQLVDTPLASFPTAEELAQQVVESLQSSAPDTTISLATNHGAEFNNNVILEVRASGAKHAVHIDPVRQSANVVLHPENEEPLQPLLEEISNITLASDPYTLAREAVPQIMAEAGIDASPSVKPMGWCKLNFLADVNGEPARVTYVLRDGHVDVTRYQGEDGMSPRQFFMRLHTSHGQPPHWNARMFWSVALDTMAIAMVTWALTGLVMWWQIKRTRLIGGIVIALSWVTAAWMVFSMIHFYATTKL